MKEIQLTQGQVAFVDDEDYEHLNQFKWHARWDNTNHSYYASRTLRVDGKRTTLNMHREIMNARKGEIVDHINGGTLFNCKSNLRITSNTGNCRNGKLRHTNKVGISGVCYSKRDGKWIARINSRENRVSLGRFNNLFDAACARKAAELVHGYHHNHGRDNSMKEKSRIVSEPRIRSDNTSGHKGINFHKQSSKWRVRIHHDKTEIHVGLFDTIEDAISAKESAEIASRSLTAPSWTDRI